MKKAVLFVRSECDRPHVS